jgi:predicted lipoprotein with Yx(FWY)xxD motif
VRSVSGTGDVLVDAKGRTLYIADQEMTGKVLCSSDACTAIWTPLTVAAGQQPTGPSQVSSMLATVKRPDGSLQVAFNGAPLYTFSFDHAAGDVGGNGQKDSFGGTDFSWHTATASGAAPAPAPSTSDASTPNYGNGGY